MNAACLLLVLLLLAASTWAADFPVADFGAVGDGLTDDGPAFRAAFAAACAAKEPSRVLCEARTYRLGEYTGDFYTFVLEGAKDITFEGGGATLLFHPRNMAFLVRHSERVALRDFKVDYDPLPCTQGDIVSLDRAAGAFEVRIHKGYPLPPTEERLQSAYRHGCFIAAEKRWYTWDWAYLTHVDAVDAAQRRSRITLQEGQKAVLERIQPGMRFVFRNPQWASEDYVSGPLVRRGTGAEEGVFLNAAVACIRLERSADCVLDHLDIYMSPNMTFHVDGCEGTYIRHCRLMYKPDSDRLTVGLSDGLHCKENLTGPFVEDCYFEGLWDDAINIAAEGYLVGEVRSPTELVVHLYDIFFFDAYLKPGQQVFAWDNTTGRILGEATLTEVIFAGNMGRIIKLSEPIAGVIAGQSPAVGASLIWARPGPSWVKRCTFTNSLKTACLANANSVFEDNLIEDCAYGVHRWLDVQLGAAIYPYDITLRNNTFRRVWPGALVLRAFSANPEMAPLPANLVIEGNRIEEAKGDGIVLTGLSGITLRDNLIELAPDTPEQFVPLRLENCAGLVEAGNTVNDPR